MSAKTLYLVCNAHLDPVWLWEWEEGAGEALSTFRTAAHLCEEFEDFIFCHNEAVLYEWVESFDSELFSKIQQLVKEGRWHIMGGWYIQPDCNMPSGESFLRQILLGKRYFMKKFGVEPKTAVNLDPFGHTRGLVQILSKTGYSSYLFCRPAAKGFSFPADDFIWVGYDGSEILAHRAPDHYNSVRGKARERVEKWMAENPEQKTGLLLWGIGNHGGGPSREDLEQLRALISEDSGWNVLHGIPEDYFETLKPKESQLLRHNQDLNPWAVGCYTTMTLIKQKHRRLENTYYLTEKMVTHAFLQGLMNYPRRELREALKDLLFCEFHDILPGTSITQVEAYALQRMDHGLEILSRLKAHAFFALVQNEPEAKDGEFPIFVYNPHPYPVNGTLICEFQPQEPNSNKHIFWMPEMIDNEGKILPLQIEKESSNISMEQRKRVVFSTELKPGQMNRFICRLKEVKAKGRGFERYSPKQGPLVFKSDLMELSIDEETGLVKRFYIDGVDFLKERSFLPLVIKDYPDPWGMNVRAFRNILGSFELMTEEEAAEWAGVSSSKLAPIRIIEEGPVRTVVEILLRYNHSAICQRYKIPKKGSEFEVEIRVLWNEKDRLLKLSIPTVFFKGTCKGQVAYGMEDFKKTGEEQAAQKWIGVVSPDQMHALTVINEGIYGFDYAHGEIRLSLLRSAAYSAHPVEKGLPLVPQDRFEPRIDQGERMFRLWINAGQADERFLSIDREAQLKNEKPMILSCFPSGKGKKVKPLLVVEDSAAEVTAVKMAEENNRLIIRLFEPTGKEREARLTIPCLDLSFNLHLRGFEIKTIAVDLVTKEISEVDLMEKNRNKEEF